MKTFLLISALAFSLPHAAAIAAPKLSRAELKTACLTEAQWPVTGSAAYQNGSVHQKAQMTNAYNADVRSLKAMCVRMDQATPAELSTLGGDCQSLIEATARKYATRSAIHLSRGSAICKAMTVPSV